MPPYIYIENDRFVGECTTQKAFKRKGPAHEAFEAIDVLDDLAEKAVQYIHQQKPANPFFSYIALASPHTPIVPTPEWQGKSGLGAYGDFQMQTDAVMGQIVEAVDAAGFRENTLIILSSDNGCSKAAGIKGLEAKGHYPSAQFRGSKADLWDGGHRVPFIVRWLNLSPMLRADAVRKARTQRTIWMEYVCGKAAGLSRIHSSQPAAGLAHRDRFGKEPCRNRLVMVFVVGASSVLPLFAAAPWVERNPAGCGRCSETFRALHS